MAPLVKHAITWTLRDMEKKTEGSCRIYPLIINHKFADLQLVPSDCTEITAPFEPTQVIEGKYLMALNLTDEIYQRLAEIEAQIQSLVAVKHPGLEWTSSLHAPEKYPASLRVKMYAAVQVYDDEDKQVPPPSSWRRFSLIPIIRPSAWAHEKSAGVWWNLVAVKLSKPLPRTYTFI